MDNILIEIEAYLEETSMSATAFGRAAVGSPNFVFRLRGDEDFKWSSVKKARQYMADNPPKNTKIEHRPEIAAAEASSQGNEVAS